MVGIDFLKKSEVFKGLADEQLTAVQTCCHVMEFQKDNRIFAEGDNANYLWLVMQGKVDIRFDLPGKPTSDENNVSSVSETKAFGWSALVPPNKYRLSAYCASETCKVVRIEKEALVNLFGKDTGIAYRVMTNVISVIGKRFHQLQGTIKDSPLAKVEVVVHLGTCGIAAGAREIMNSMIEKITKSGRTDIKMTTGGCLGKCYSEPNVTVKIGGMDPVVYQRMTADRMFQVFDKHIIKGEVQKNFVLAD